MYKIAEAAEAANIPLPNNFNELCIMFDEIFKFNNILCIRHSTGGMFLRDLFLNKSNVTRISYETNNVEQPKCIIGLNGCFDYLDKDIYILIQHNDLKNVLNTLNKKFDLICLDPFHEYAESTSDISLCASFLSEDGILICHDCCPTTKDLVSSNYKHGSWCGVTYYCFIEFAYNNPDYFYSVINRDFGLGIISKKKIPFVKKIIFNEMQQKLIHIYNNSPDEAFDYFIINSKVLINLIDE